MIHLTIFGAHEGRLQPDKLIYVTLFGGCEVVRPTLARQLLAKRQAERDKRPTGRRPVFLTVFGASAIKSPTLAEEFIDSREMINSGLLAMADWERSMVELGRGDGAVASLTIFGGFGECEIPSEDEEVDSLAVQRHLGNISACASETLQYGIGQHGVERCATIRRAMTVSA